MSSLNFGKTFVSLANNIQKLDHTHSATANFPCHKLRFG